MAFNISQLQLLIAKNETDQAIDILVSGIDQIRSKQLRSDIIHLSGRWQSYKSTHRKGTQDHATLAVEQRQINDSLLGLLSVIAEEQNSGNTLLKHPKNNWKSRLAIAATIIAVLAGIAEFTGLNLMSFLKPEPEKTETSPKQGAEEKDRSIKNDSPIPTDTPPGQKAEGQKTKSTETEKQAPALPNATKADKLVLETKTNKGSGTVTFSSSETMRIFYKVNRPCLLRVIYKLADGRLILFENDREITTEQVGDFVELGDGYEAAEPFGEEQLYFFVQTTAFPELLTEMSEDGYVEIKEGLKQSLQKTRGMKKKLYLAESKLSIITQL